MINSIYQTCRSAIWYILLFLFGAGLCLYYGRMGLMPLDQSIVWDYAWRLLNGQIPYRDFTAPGGLTPALLQAAFFKLFGVTWLSYVLHAAIFNGLFTILCFRFLRELGTTTPIAFMFALSSAFYFYPPFGTAYYDQHSLFFGFAFIFLCQRTTTSQSTQRLLLLPIVALAALLSKPIPGSFLIIIGFYRLYTSPNKINWLYILKTVVATITVIAATFIALGCDSDIFTSAYLKGPAHIANERLSIFFTLRPFYASIVLINEFKYSILVLALAQIFILFTKLHTQEKNASEQHNNISFALALFFSTLCFILLTLNQYQNSLALLPLCLALWFESIQKKLTASQAKRSYVLPLKRIGCALFCLALFFDVWGFNLRTNETRIVHDMDFSSAHSKVHSPPQILDFLKWALPPGVPYTAEEISPLIERLKKSDSNFLWFGDSVFVYALTNKPSTNFNLWYHPGLTMPLGQTTERASFERHFIESLHIHRVQTIVIEKKPWFDLNLQQWPMIKSALERNICSKTSTQNFELWILCDPIQQ